MQTSVVQPPLWLEASLSRAPVLRTLKLSDIQAIASVPVCFLKFDSGLVHSLNSILHYNSLSLYLYSTFKNIWVLFPLKIEKQGRKNYKLLGFEESLVIVIFGEQHLCWIIRGFTFHFLKTQSTKQPTVIILQILFGLMMHSLFYLSIV